MKMYGSLSDEDLNEWERLPLVMRVLCSAQMGAWLLRRDENKEKSEHKTGRWRKVSMDKYVQHATYYYECSECGDQHIGQANYCPNCGCKMEVKE